MRECAFWIGQDRDFGAKKLRGDLILVRHPLNIYGKKEGKLFLWAHIEGMDELLDSLDLSEIGEWGKYRYSLPVTELRRVLPTVDMGRLLNSEEEYQPLVDARPGGTQRVVSRDGTVQTYGSLRVLTSAVQLPEWPIIDKSTGRRIDGIR